MFVGDESVAKDPPLFPGGARPRDFTLLIFSVRHFHYGISEENLSAEPGQENEDKRINLGQKIAGLKKKKK